MTLTTYSPLNQIYLNVSILSFIILAYFHFKATIFIIFITLSLVLLFRFAYQKFWVIRTTEYRKKGSILITGCSSGIGAATAKRLLEDGYHVLGTFRKAEDVDIFKREFLFSSESGKIRVGDTFLSNESKQLKKSKQFKGKLENNKKDIMELESRFTPLILDVSKSDTIDAALPTIKVIHKKFPLIALINNAGVQVSGIVECLDIDHHVRDAFDINVLGVYRMIQKLLPLLRESKKQLGRARIINVSSIAGLIALPSATGYSATKWALQAITQGLRNEVSRFGIEVCTVNPGSTRTNFRLNAKTELERVLNSATNEQKEKLYPEYFNLWQKRYDACFKEGVGYEDGKGIPVEWTVDVLSETIETSNLRESYMIGPEGHFVTLLSIVPQFLVDLALRKTYKT